MIDGSGAPAGSPANPSAVLAHSGRPAPPKRDNTLLYLAAAAVLGTVDGTERTELEGEGVLGSALNVRVRVVRVLVLFRGHEAMVEQLVSNILQNAVTYCDVNGQVLARTDINPT